MEPIDQIQKQVKNKVVMTILYKLNLLGLRWPR